jgi:hypothetical protein
LEFNDGNVWIWFRLRSKRKMSDLSCLTDERMGGCKQLPDGTMQAG